MTLDHCANGGVLKNVHKNVFAIKFEVVIKNSS